MLICTPLFSILNKASTIFSSTGSTLKPILFFSTQFDTLVLLEQIDIILDPAERGGDETDP